MLECPDNTILFVIFRRILYFHLRYFLNTLYIVSSFNTNFFSQLNVFIFWYRKSGKNVEKENINSETSKFLNDFNF